MGTAIIAAIDPDSLAAELGLEIGDKLLKINDIEPQDLIDFQILWANEDIDLLVEKKDGEQLLFSIDKDFDEGLGVAFEWAVFDKIRTCQNKCKFCFIEQMAPAMRTSLYTKDDDYRLSFLQGNFITLTNLVQTDLERIKSLHLSPLYVSVHTTDPKLRVQLVGNKKAGHILDQLTELTEAGIEVHTQVVLCRKLNDGAYLEKTINDLSKLWPGVQSLAIVPVGVTKHRSNLEDFPPFDQDYSRELITMVTGYQQKFQRELGDSLVHLSDEFYLRAAVDFPPASRYGDFPQTENGVGLSRLFLDEFAELKGSLPQRVEPRKFYLATSVLGGQVLAPIARELNQIEGLELELKIVENSFFGSQVTVTGLLTGTDLIRGLRVEPGSRVIIPDVMLKKDEDLFLDGLSPQEVAQRLQVELLIVGTNGADLIEKIIDG